MPEANIQPHNRAGVYPRDAFDRDTRRNAETKTEVLYRLRITSSPDANGVFSLARTSRHVAEQNPEGDVVFVSPHRYQGDDALMQGPDYREPEEKGAAARASQDANAAYDMFISRVIEAANQRISNQRSASMRAVLRAFTAAERFRQFRSVRQGGERVVGAPQTPYADESWRPTRRGKSPARKGRRKHEMASRPR